MSAVTPPPTPRVLIVEDERDLRELYNSWLADTYDVITVGDASNAISEIIDTDSPLNVLLLDRNLPDQPAQAVIAAVERHRSDARIAIISATKPEPDIIDLDIDSYLHKPVTQEEIQTLVERLIRRADYNRRLKSYYANAEKLATLRQFNNLDELQSDERYRELIQEMEELREEMDSMVDFEDTHEVEEILRDVLAFREDQKE